jgi:formylglycine-generating enzyme required for sulfatase activity
MKIIIHGRFAMNQGLAASCRAIGESLCLVLLLAFMSGCRNKAVFANGMLTVKGVQYEFAAIPPGEFVMGSNEGSAAERPVHRVELDGFWLGRTEVTQALWRAVMGTAKGHWRQGDEYPMDGISWNDCQEFIRRLNAMSGGGFRLPSEAEWEYACRAGTTGERYGNLDAVAWYEHSTMIIMPVRRKEANHWGLYDMLGNVWEICQDFYDENYYAESPARNPKGPSGGARVWRGGGWNSDASMVRAAYRGGGHQDDRGSFNGMRLAANR